MLSAVAKQLPKLSLLDALGLTVLVARKSLRCHSRVAARWLLRYLGSSRDDRGGGAAAASLVAVTGGA